MLVVVIAVFVIMVVSSGFTITSILSTDYCTFYARVAPLLPEFASHWGIIIQETNPKDAKNDDVWLYHLCLEEDDRPTSGSTGG